MLLFRGEGPKLFTHYLDDIMHTPEGLKWWYLRANGQIAERATSLPATLRGWAGAKWISPSTSSA